ncbi:MAG: cytochrome c biogenesis protein ResB [Bacteroidales bacterium]
MNRIISNYTLSLATSLALTLVGTALHGVSNFSIEVWSAPLNILVLLAIVIISVTISKYYRDTIAYRFFTNTHTTLGLLTGFGLLLLVLGFVPQLLSHEVRSDMGWFEVLYRRLTNSAPFILNLIYLLFILLLVILKKRISLSFRHLSFQVNHIGLWLAMAAGLFGSADKREHKILLEPDRVTQNGFTLRGDIERLPFSLMLNQFSIERYPDKLILLAKINDEVVELGECEINSDISDYEIDDLYFKAKYNADNHLIVELNDTIETLKSNNSLIEVGEHMVLLRKEGKPRHYSATISMEYKRENFKDDIAVNKPIIRDDYYIYLESFDQIDESELPRVVLRLVKDPWINIAYAGLWMMMIGALAMMAVGPITLSSTNDNRRTR